MGKHSKEEILAEALEARVQEVLLYQVNIDNYRLALQEIASMPPEETSNLSEFVEKLQGLLGSEMLEQKKAKIMLTVIRKQLEK